MALQTFIVGFGRSGLDLHWKTLRRLRESGNPLFATAPAVVWDARDITAEAHREGLIPVASLKQARELLDPRDTVVHLCTTPDSRLGLLNELADLGFRRILVEKPLAADLTTAYEIDALRHERDLELTVVAQWLESGLVRRMQDLIDSAELGRLVSIKVAQHKSRVDRTLSSAGHHPTAFDVELPHSLGCVLRLAGNAWLTGAALLDMVTEDAVVPGMGSARTVLEHDNGVCTEIFSDLVSPVRVRRVVLTFTEGTAIGFFPVSGDDNYAHLRILRGIRQGVSVFADDALSAFFVKVYTDYSQGVYRLEDFSLACRAVELIAAAKDQCLTQVKAEEVMSHVS
ncbi:MAG: oxidoreductase [Streptosporangiaceae bacterium]